MSNIASSRIIYVGLNINSIYYQKLADLSCQLDSRHSLLN